MGSRLRRIKSVIRDTKFGIASKRKLLIIFRGEISKVPILFDYKAATAIVS